MEERFGTPLPGFVNKYLVQTDVKCYRHCEKPAKFVPIYQKESSLVGAYVCPEGYVSRVVYFADNPDAHWFEEFLGEQAGPERLRGKDIRKATRYGWELGGEAEMEISKVSKSGKLVQYYWTFYPQNDQDEQVGTFLCPKEKGGCGKLYTELKTDDAVLCPECRAA